MRRPRCPGRRSSHPAGAPRCAPRQRTALTSPSAARPRPAGSRWLTSSTPWWSWARCTRQPATAGCAGGNSRVVGYLRKRWDAAAQLRAPADRHALAARLADLRDAVERVRLPGRGGSAERAVLLVVINAGLSQSSDCPLVARTAEREWTATLHPDPLADTAQRLGVVGAASAHECRVRHRNDQRRAFVHQREAALDRYRRWRDCGRPTPRPHTWAVARRRPPGPGRRSGEAHVRGVACGRELPNGACSPASPHTRGWPPRPRCLRAQPVPSDEAGRARSPEGRTTPRSRARGQPPSEPDLWRAQAPAADRGAADHNVPGPDHGAARGADGRVTAPVAPVRAAPGNR